MLFSKITRRSAIKTVLYAAGLSLAGSILSACATSQPETVVYLVRHAEKVVGKDVGKNPVLTDKGEARAALLVELLGTEPITHIHSSDYIRTRTTAVPLADAKDLEIEIYNPRDLPALAAKISQQGGQHLVVGHSNTIPETVDALGGDGGDPIEEKTEYDRLYKVRINSNGTVQTDMQRYGDRSKTAN